MPFGHATTETYGFKNLPGILLGVGYAAAVVAGLFGFNEPLPTSVEKTLGSASIVSLMWNMALIWAGLTGLIARWFAMPRIEIIAVDALAAVLLVWALMVFVSTTSNQAGIIFICTAFLFLGWSNGTRRYLDRLRDIRRELEE